MEKNKSLTIVISLIAFIIAFLVIFQIGIIVVSNERSKSKQTLTNSGPWSMNEVWKDENSTLYLTSKKNDSIPNFYDVTAYIKIENVWYPAQFNLLQNSTVVSLDTIDGDTYMTATAEIKNESLILKDINRMVDGVSPGVDEIILYISPKNDALPFNIEK